MLVKLALYQVINGLEYKGTLEFAALVFDYNLKLGVPIDELDDQQPPGNDDASMKAFARHLFQFELEYADKVIEITDDVFGILLNFVGKTAIDFYNDPMTVSNNESYAMGQLLDKDSAMSKIMNVKATIGTSTSFEIDDAAIPQALKSVA